MNEQKNLTQNGLTTPNTILIFASLLIIGVCIYMTNHYFEAFFPSKLGSESALCDISSFFNCDTATTSSASNIMGVPVSLFGMLIGFFLLLGSIFPSPGMEKTNGFLVKINLAGCLILFLYSLIVLKSLCPMCTVYYLLSALCFYLFAKYSSCEWQPELKSFSIFGAVFIISFALVYNHFHDKREKQHALNKQIIVQFFSLENLGDPTEESPYNIATADQDFSKAPLRVSIFSDFQCPFCAKEATQMNELAKKYEGKINIQYFFYPLDRTCNDKIKTSFHQYACAAANLAACSESNFKQVHDEIFNKQDQLSFKFVEGLAKKHQVLDCYNAKAKLDLVKKSMEIANNYNIKSTPTLILNGRKIEGAISTDQFQAIFDAILAK